MNIRILDKTEDIPAFRTIRIEGVYDTPESFRATPEEMESNTLEDFENQLSGKDTGDFFVGAFVEGSLVGVAALYHEKYVKLAHRGEIGSVYVKPDYFQS